MSEKEIYARLQKTVFADVFHVPTTTWNHKIQTIPQELEEYNCKLTEFLIHKTKLDVLLDVPVSVSDQFFAPVDFAAFFNAYDEEHIRLTGQVEAKYSTRYDGQSLYDLALYDETRYKALLPQLVETYPLLFITALEQQGLLHDELLYAVSAYIEEHYFDTDAFQSATWAINDGVFEFIIEPKEEYRHAFAFGDFIGYRVIEREEPAC